MSSCQSSAIEARADRLDRRRFLGEVGALSAVALLGQPGAASAEPLPEIKRICLENGPYLCFAPLYVAEALLHLEGFEEVVSQLPYGHWRDWNPEDTLRFHALRLKDAGMLKSTPNEAVARCADWRFLNELKKELKV
jgi:hypothetical protein